MLAALVLSVFTTIVSSMSTFGSGLDVSTEPGVDLKRGAFFGAKVAPVSDEVRQRLKLDAGVGILIEEVIPGSTAEAAGFKAGDVVLALDGAKIAGAGEFVQAIGRPEGRCRGHDRISPRRRTPYRRT